MYPLKFHLPLQFLNFLIHTFFFFSTTITIYPTCASKILMFSPQATSHVLGQVHLGEVLVRRGHIVHLIVESHFPKNLIESFRKKGIVIEFFDKPAELSSFASNEFQSEYVSRLVMGQVTFFDMYFKLVGVIQSDCELMMADSRLLKKLSEIDFDLIVTEPIPANMCHLTLVAYLNKPYVFLANMFIPTDIRAAIFPSFWPRYFNSYDTDEREINFYTRFMNFVFYIFLSFVNPFRINLNDTLINKYVPIHSRHLSYYDILLGADLYFYENDHHLSTPIPVFPNMISLAGLSCGLAKSLSSSSSSYAELGRTIEAFRNSPTERPYKGIILMSFGSTAGYLPAFVVEKFLRAFSAFPNYLIIAKLSYAAAAENRTTETTTTATATINSSAIIIPGNVRLYDWIPQNDLLGQRDTKLFITHCGNNGQHEALYHAVPMIGFPLFAEQAENCRRASVKRFGLCVNVRRFTVTELVDRMDSILSRGDEYRKSIRKMSEAFRDQPMSAGDRGVYWIEYVLKYGGEYLRSPATKLSVYEFYSFDILLFIGLLFVVLVFIGYKIVVVSIGLLVNRFVVGGGEVKGRIEVISTDKDKKVL